MGAENAELIPQSQAASFRMTQAFSADNNPRMAKSIQDRVQERMNIMGLNPSSASLKAGLSRDAIRKLMDRPEQIPTGRTLNLLASALEVSPQWLLTGDDVRPAPRQEVSPANIPLPARSDMPNDVPVLGTAAGSHLRGAFQLMSDPIDYVRRPFALMNARNIYALYVEGTSMEPQYAPGDLIYIHPDRPPRAGDAVVVQCQLAAEGYIEATIGIYVKRTGENVVIRKHNPSAEIEIARATVISVQKVLSLNEIFGV